MPIILNPRLYKKIKQEADTIYEKPSAYKSGWIVKTYKSRGGEYADDNQSKNLERWFKENWKDIGGKEYPVYRPTKRISKKTPLTADEIDPIQAEKQIALKQDIKGDANLPKFKSKGSGLYHITDYTKKQAKKMGLQVFPSDNPKYKIEVYDKNGVFMFYGGSPNYSDYPSYIQSHGKEYADERRRLYKIRHEKDRNKLGSAGYYADQILW
jgi:hypothetical protein